MNLSTIYDDDYTVYLVELKNIKKKNNVVKNDNITCYFCQPITNEQNFISTMI